MYYIIIDSEMLPQVPPPILKQVYHQNLEYLHTRSHFSYAYFQFMKQLLILNYNFAKNQIDSTNSSDAVVCICLSICAILSIYLSIYMYLHVSTFMYLSIYLFIYLSIYQFRINLKR